MHRISFFVTLLLLMVCMTCAEHSVAEQAEDTAKKYEYRYKASLIVLGSEDCLPCKEAEAVIEQVKTRYEDQVQVLYYDTDTAEGHSLADRYHVTAIPSWIFLDRNGKEYYRHTGSFSEGDIIQVLKQKGVE
jgi:thioredoxin 1